jgi:hypothetical protein
VTAGVLLWCVGGRWRSSRQAGVAVGEGAVVGEGATVGGLVVPQWRARAAGAAVGMGEWAWLQVLAATWSDWARMWRDWVHPIHKG